MSPTEAGLNVAAGCYLTAVREQLESSDPPVAGVTDVRAALDVSVLEYRDAAAIARVALIAGADRGALHDALVDLSRGARDGVLEVLADVEWRRIAGERATHGEVALASLDSIRGEVDHMTPLLRGGTDHAVVIAQALADVERRLREVREQLERWAIR